MRSMTTMNKRLDAIEQRIGDSVEPRPAIVIIQNPDEETEGDFLRRIRELRKSSGKKVPEPSSRSNRSHSVKHAGSFSEPFGTGQH